MVEIAEHPEVLAAREVLVDRRVLAREADDSAYGVGLLDDVEPIDRRGARVRQQEGGEDADRGRLAGSIGAEEAVDRALRDAEIQTVQCDHIAVLLDEAPSLDDVGHGMQATPALLHLGDAVPPLPEVIEQLLAMIGTTGLEVDGDLHLVDGQPGIGAQMGDIDDVCIKRADLGEQSGE